MVQKYHMARRRIEMKMTERQALGKACTMPTRLWAQGKKQL